ncbi:unnamed protein product [Triticum turgidum subsp. durum]|uniref:Uncharacterized protein n=1 Tax=Triticum turgidum subsp. durum TaxID=4567 RepID=A0A9R1C5J7_TRITD|nr:unnamed protein product [Triticum turgidum subsp. durum]
MAQCETSLSAFVFSSSTEQWQATASKNLRDLGLDRFESITMSHGPVSCQRRHYAYGCFYWDWVVISINKLLVFDTIRMEFSVADLPPGDWSMQGLAFVEAGEGRLGMLCFDGEFASHLSLSYAIVHNSGESPNQWLMEKTISLDSGYHYFIKAVTERCLLLMRTESLPGSPIEKPLLEYFTMDMETLQLQRVCAKRFKLRLPTSSIYAYFFQTGIYTNFPPSLSPPRTV